MENDDTVKSKNSIFTIKNLPKLVVVVLAVTIICLLFPQHDTYQTFNYEVGQNWEYPDLKADKNFTAHIKRTNSLTDSITNTQVSYLKSALIVKQGQYLTDSLHQTVAQYLEFVPPRKSSYLSSKSIIYFLGYFILTALILGALIFYALKFFTEDFNSVTGISFLVFWPVIFSMIAFWVSHASGLKPISYSILYYSNSYP